MPLQPLNTPSYIKRTRVFPVFRETLTDGEVLVPKNFNVAYEFELPQLIQNVIGIELINYSFHNAMISTFVGRYKTLFPHQFEIYSSGEVIDDVRNTVSGSSIVDIELGDPTGVFTTIVSFDWAFINETFSYAGLLITADNLASTFYFFFTLVYYPAIPAVPGFDPNDYNLYTNIVNHTDTGLISMYIQEKLAPFDYGTIRFLFATGPHEADSAYKQMGFDKVDTTPDPTTNGVYAPYPMNGTPFRYMNLNIKEFPEFKPLARLYAQNTSLSAPSNPSSLCVRLLTRPLQRLTSLHIELTLAGDRPPAFYTSRDHELEFEILSLEPSNRIPSWVKQKLVY